LRGVTSELLARGHQVQVYEPADGWSRANLLRHEGAGAIDGFHRAYPELSSTLYRLHNAGSTCRIEEVQGGRGPGRRDEAVSVASPHPLNGEDADASPSRLGREDADSSPSRSPESVAAGVPLDLEAVLDGADLVLVHEWNDPALVKKLGEARRRGGGFILFLHDTHHRAVTDPKAMARFDLRYYDGVLAFGRILRDLYIERGWAARAWTWHEGADVRRFHPLVPAEQGLGGSESSAWATGETGAFRPPEPALDASHGIPRHVAGEHRRMPSDTASRTQGERTGLVWIGNWGDDERTSELREFVLDPVRDLGIRAVAYGVRYPAEGRAALAEAGMQYAGRLPNHAAPAVYARHAVTVHVPRRPYAQALPGIPTIRVFEALACGIPLVCAPWDDVEGLFSPGEDYLRARNGLAMRQNLRTILHDRAFAAAMAEHGLATVLARHTCAHRVDELLAVYEEVRGGTASRNDRQEAVGYE
jgi:spore maturation protein CgeB